MSSSELDLNQVLEECLDVQQITLERIKKDLSLEVITEQELKQNVEIGHFLGEGVSSTVYEGKNLETGEECAVKKIKIETIVRNENLIREIHNLTHMEHPKIVKLQKVLCTSDTLYLLLQLAKGLPLFDVLVDRKNYTEIDVCAVVSQILEAVSYMHQKGYAHRDLKPENLIFLEYFDPHSDCDLSKQNIMVVDFGYSKKMSENGSHTPLGTLGYKAPELIKKEPYSNSVDCWAVGVITYIMLCGFPPFFSCSENKKNSNFLYSAPFWYFFNQETPELHQDILSGTHHFPDEFWKDISDEAKDFVDSFLQLESRKRMTAEQGLKHPWITGRKFSTRNLFSTQSFLRITRKVTLREKKYVRSTLKIQRNFRRLKKNTETLHFGWLEMKNDFSQATGGWTLRFMDLLPGALVFYINEMDQFPEWYGFIYLKDCVVKKKKEATFEIRNQKGNCIFSDNLREKINSYKSFYASFRVQNLQDLSIWMRYLDDAIKMKSTL